MNSFIKTAAAGAALLVTGPALAAPTITAVSVKGAATNFVWSTNPTATQDTLFVAPGSGVGTSAVVNPSNNFGSGTGLGNPDPNNFGDYVFTLYGDGYPAAGVGAGRVTSFPNSDALYTVSVTIKDGSKTGTLIGTWNPTAQVFANTSPAFSGSTGIYQLDGFDWGRQVQNYVGTRSSTNTASAVPGSLRDYRGDLMLSVSAVPEPATWALMILGFGVVGGMLRTRRKSGVAFA